MSNFNSESKLIDFVNEWLIYIKKPEVKPSTYDRLITSISTLKRYQISQIRICDITIRIFSNYVQQLIQDGFRISTIKKLMRIVSSPIAYATHQRILQYNPCLGVKTPSEANLLAKTRQIQAYTKEEQELLIKEMDKHKWYGYEAIKLILETGLRVGEVLALRWEDVNIQRKRIYVHSTSVRINNIEHKIYVQEGAKSKSSNRIVPLNEKAIAAIEKMEKCSNNEFVFANNDKQLAYENLRTHVRYACERAGIQYYGMHVFRHTFATNQYYKGTDIKILSKILGHSETSITYNTYIHLYGDAFDEMLNAVS